MSLAKYLLLLLYDCLDILILVGLASPAPGSLGRLARVDKHLVRLNLHRWCHCSTRLPYSLSILEGLIPNLLSILESLDA